MIANRYGCFRVPQRYFSVALFGCVMQALSEIVSKILSDHSALEERLMRVFLFEILTIARFRVHGRSITGTIESAIVSLLCIFLTYHTVPLRMVLNFSSTLWFLSFHSHFAILSELPTHTCPTIWELIKVECGDIPRSGSYFNAMFFLIRVFFQSANEVRVK